MARKFTDLVSKSVSLMTSQQATRFDRAELEGFSEQLGEATEHLKEGAALFDTLANVPTKRAFEKDLAAIEGVKADIDQKLAGNTDPTLAIDVLGPAKALKGIPLTSLGLVVDAINKVERSAEPEFVNPASPEMSEKTLKTLDMLGTAFDGLESLYGGITQTVAARDATLTSKIATAPEPSQTVDENDPWLVKLGKIASTVNEFTYSGTLDLTKEEVKTFSEKSKDVLKLLEEAEAKIPNFDATAIKEAVQRIQDNAEQDIGIKLKGDEVKAIMNVEALAGQGLTLLKSTYDQSFDNLQKLNQDMEAGRLDQTEFKQGVQQGFQVVGAAGEGISKLGEAMDKISDLQDILAAAQKRQAGKEVGGR